MTYFLIELVMYASKQLEENTLGNINSAHEYNIMKPIFITGIHAFRLFKRYKERGYKLYRVPAWRELPDKDSWPLFPAASGGTEPFLSCSCSPVRSQLAQIRAGHRLLSSLVGLELALDMQNHQAVVTVILIDCHTLGNSARSRL